MKNFNLKKNATLDKCATQGSHQLHYNAHTIKCYKNLLKKKIDYAVN